MEAYPKRVFCGEMIENCVTCTKPKPTFCELLLSPPTRGVWIEIPWSTKTDRRYRCHPPRGGCGLKCRHPPLRGSRRSHPPRGGCGLKYILRGLCGVVGVVTPHAGVWIEICTPPARRWWRKGPPPRGGCGLKWEPARNHRDRQRVTPHAGGVD